MWMLVFYTYIIVLYLLGNVEEGIQLKHWFWLLPIF